MKSLARSFLWLLAAWLLAPGLLTVSWVPAQQGSPLGEAATGTLVYNYEQSEHWAMRALVLLSLGADYHPAAATVLVDALKSSDGRLPAFAVEQLLRTGDRVLPAIATAEVVAQLVGLADHKNDLLRERAQQVLGKLFRDAGATDGRSWKRWWSECQREYAPAAWVAAAQPQRGEGTVTQQLVERAFDLRDAGLEVVFVLDSTGSMQLAIDAARDAIDEIATILAGVTPKLELGLVHYKDFGDMGDGAKLLVPLTKNYKKVRETLAKLQASGGGDTPERIEKGIEVALDRPTGWNKNANRMMLVIGDAPPHADVEKELLDLVKRAHEHPFARGKGPTTGRKEDVRPFITSTIATNPAVKGIFEEIAKAGGGAAVVLDMNATKKVDGKVISKKRSAGEQIAEHVLLLSFGATYAAQLRVFVDVFFEYRQAGLY